jgi:hypothetical protein
MNNHIINLVEASGMRLNPKTKMYEADLKSLEEFYYLVSREVNERISSGYLPTS